MIDKDSRSGNSEKKDMDMAGLHRHLESAKTPSRPIAEGMALEEWQTTRHLLRGKSSIVRAAKKCWSRYQEESRRSSVLINAG